MGLSTGLWVSAQVRICDRNFIPATIVRRGDPDAGTVLLTLADMAVMQSAAFAKVAAQAKAALPAEARA